MRTNQSNSESKNERFVRLAEKRTNMLLDGIRKLGNLSNRKNYDYTDEHVKKIFSALNKELNKTKILFQEGGNSQEKIFKL